MKGVGTTYPSGGLEPGAAQSISVQVVLAPSALSPPAALSVPVGQGSHWYALTYSSWPHSRIQHVSKSALPRSHDAATAATGAV